MKIKIKKDIIIDTDEMSLDELQNINDNMQMDIDMMQVEIDTAKAKRVATGEYSDIEWWRKINLALRLTRRNRQRLIRAITEKKKSQKQAENKTFERTFIQLAKTTLEPATFQEIIDATHEAMEC